jgi:hypothetical protein
MRKEYGMVGLLCATILLSGCGAREDQPLAKVGPRYILTGEFEAALHNLPSNYKVLTESGKGKRKILDNLVKKELLLLEAERRGLQKQSAIAAEISQNAQKNRLELEKQIKDLRLRLKRVHSQSYENVMLRELNDQLRAEPAEKSNHSPEEIQTYYEDYVRKLKIVNPAAIVPALSVVDPQIRAILTEEKLLRQLEKTYKVEIKEKLFSEKYGEESGQVIIDDRMEK